jgi:uncharacterized protein (TIGR02145 family)
MNYSNSSNLNPSNIKGVCPSGWHIPSDAEWKQLEFFLGMSESEIEKGGIERGSIEGGLLKHEGTFYWQSPNVGATNKTGFSALPSGFMTINGHFSDLGRVAVFGTATSENRQRVLYNSYSTIGRYGDDAFNVMVRCIKD